MLHRSRSPYALGRARGLRAGMSESEQRLWRLLRRKALGFRFRRQHPFGPYTLDFYCPQARVCVEVDGDAHTERPDRDARRDAWLAEAGVVTVRIWTAELWDNEDGMLERIWTICTERSGPPPS